MTLFEMENYLIYLELFLQWDKGKIKRKKNSKFFKLR